MSDDKIIIDPGEEDAIGFDEGIVRKNKLRVLTFSLAEENYCVSLEHIKEIVRPSAITRVPGSPDFIMGVINLRGEIIAVLDIRYFFGLSAQEKIKDTRILITDITGSCMGIIVDGLGTIVDIEEEKIQPPLATLKGKLAEYTKGETRLGDEIVALLDLKKVLNNEAVNNLRKGAG